MAIPSSRSRARRLAPPSIGAEPQPVSVAIGGSFVSDDPSTIPDGYVYKLHNMLMRPGPRIDARPPFVYDSVMRVTGLALWEDLSKVTRFVAFDSDGKLYLKNASGETWVTEGFPITTGLPANARLSSWTNYRGKLYALFDDGAGTPSAALVFDGVAVNLSPFNSPILGKCIAAFGDRLFIAYGRIVVQNLLGTTKAYVATGGQWTLVNVDAENIALGTATVGRLSPTATTGAAAYAKAENVVALATTARRVFRCDLQSESATYNMPMTLLVKLKATWETGMAVSKDALVTPSASNGFRYKASNAGTTGGAEPTWPLVLRATVTDNGITWVCVGSDTLGSLETVLVNSTDSPSFVSHYIPAELPPTPDDYDVNVRISFGNSAIPVISLAAVNFSYRDAKNDTDPSKANFGQQFTRGDFYPPFFNNESSDTRTVDLDELIWSETSEPSRIRAANNYQPKEVAGYPTALLVLGGRLILSKRRGLWTFKLTDDPDTPILPETDPLVGFGIIDSLAWTIFENELFFVADEECYRMKVGNDPVPFCGDAMRETAMIKGADWIEFQNQFNKPFASMDENKRDLWLCTQKGKAFCFSLGFGERPPAWSIHDVANGAEVSALLYNPNTRKVQAAFNRSGDTGYGLTRLDTALTQKDVIDNTATQLTGTAEFIPRPIELFAPQFELALHELGLYHVATASQSGDETTCWISFDRGKTFIRFLDVRLDVTVPRIPFPVFQSGVSVMPKFTHTGNMGKAAFSVSKCDALIELLGGIWPFTQPTQVGSSL